MEKLLVLFILGVAVGAAVEPNDFHLSISIYDASPIWHFGLPLQYYVDSISKSGEVRFMDDSSFKFLSDDTTDMVVAYKNDDEDFCHAYYTRSLNSPLEQFKELKPLSEYINKTRDLYVFTPLAAMKAAPDVFKTPIKQFHYEFYRDADMKKLTPLMYLVPKTAISADKLKDLVLTSEFEISKTGNYLSVSSVLEITRLIRSPHEIKDVIEIQPEITKRDDKLVGIASADDLPLLKRYRYELPGYSYYNTYSPYDYFFKKAHGYPSSNPYFPISEYTV